ncbi:hypothetical protein, partial [Anaerotruncus colihominis]|uniref:hypothetical protein n=1 Tax=Anaerotruncus colihominis TaxID=169435 RepID=UPI002942BD44
SEPRSSSIVSTCSLSSSMEVEDPNIRLAKLESVCLTTLPYSEVWKKAREEAQKLRKEGARYW